MQQKYFQAKESAVSVITPTVKSANEVQRTTQRKEPNNFVSFPSHSWAEVKFSFLGSIAELHVVLQILESNRSLQLIAVRQLKRDS